MEEKQPQPEQENILINDLKSLQAFLERKKINPMERVMAINLLLKEHSFYAQYRIDCPDGWTVCGSKYFIADFYIPDLNLIIETDGKGHIEEKQWIRDINKNNVYTCLGYYVLRFTWDDVMGNNEKFDVFEFFNEFSINLDRRDFKNWELGRKNGKEELLKLATPKIKQFLIKKEEKEKQELYNSFSEIGKESALPTETASDVSS